MAVECINVVRNGRHLVLQGSYARKDLVQLSQDRFGDGVHRCTLIGTLK